MVGLIRRIGRQSSRDSEARLSQILDLSIDAIITLNHRHDIVTFNAAAEKLFLWKRHEVLGQPLERLIPERFRAAHQGHIGRFGYDREAGRAMGAAGVTRGVRADGEEFAIEASISQTGTGGGQLFTVILRDVSASQATAAELLRLNRLYSALSQVNQAIATAPTRDALFQRVCRVLVEAGGFRMAWIGWHRPEIRTIVPIADYGDIDGYLQSVTIFTDDRPGGNGPSAQAFRHGRPYICDDMLQEPTLQLWQPEIQRRALRASAVFPIRLAGEVRGVLTVYAHEPRFFRDKEVALIEEAASDISIALDNFIREDERRQAEELAFSERQFSDTMIESMPGILYFYNETGRFLRWNHNFENVSGYSSDEIARMSPSDFFSTEDRLSVAGRIAEVFEWGDSFVEAPFMAKDGSITPYFFTGRRVIFEGMTCLVGVGIDISERKRAEIALRELNEGLERMVADRTGQLSMALTRAEAADRTKSAFLATMSHELRTPLNSIIGFTGILLQGLAGPLNPEQAKQLGMVRGSARHLLELINDVLDISKIEAGELEVRLKPFDIRASIDRVVGSVRTMAETKGLTLTVELLPAPLQVLSDQRRVEQILLNLLHNAIKFTERGTVSMTLRTADAGPAAVFFRVADTGIGIRSVDLAKLFQPFRQIDTGLARMHEGTGLGLAICRRLADLLGGTIEVESAFGRGSVFTLMLPLGKGA